MAGKTLSAGFAEILNTLGLASLFVGAAPLILTLATLVKGGATFSAALEAGSLAIFGVSALPVIGIAAAIGIGSILLGTAIKSRLEDKEKAKSPALAAERAQSKPLVRSVGMQPYRAFDNELPQDRGGISFSERIKNERAQAASQTKQL